MLDYKRSGEHIGQGIKNNNNKLALHCINLHELACPYINKKINKIWTWQE